MNMDEIRVEYQAELALVEDAKQLSAFWTKYLGKSGKIQGLMGGIKSVPKEEKKAYGQAVNEIKNYLEDGNITNSVNFPDCECPREGVRICIAHRNIPNTLSGFSTAFADEGINIENMLNKSKGDYAYTILDIDADGEALKADLEAIEGIIRIRVIQ